MIKESQANNKFQVDRSYRKCRKLRGVKLSLFFNCGSEVKFRGFHGIYSNHFNRNAKVPSIAKIETEIENDEDVTRPNHIEVFLQLQPPSWSRVLQVITPCTN